MGRKPKFTRSEIDEMREKYFCTNPTMTAKLVGIRCRVSAGTVLRAAQGKLRARDEEDTPRDHHVENAGSGDAIFVDARKQAIEDGRLVDITEAAKQGGIKCPVAMTSAAFSGSVALAPMPPDQDVKGRLRDLIGIFNRAEVRPPCNQKLFEVPCAPPESPIPREVALQAVCGPAAGDDPEPVITITLLGETRPSSTAKDDTRARSQVYRLFRNFANYE